MATTKKASKPKKSSTKNPKQQAAPNPNKKEKGGRKLSLGQIVAVVVLAISLFLIVDLGRRAAVNYRVQREADRLSQQVELARQHQAELLARRSYVASDLFVEEVARKELKWAKSGETVIVIMPTPEVTLPANANMPAIEAPRVPQTPAEAWWYLLWGARD